MLSKKVYLTKECTGFYIEIFKRNQLSHSIFTYNYINISNNTPRVGSGMLSENIIKKFKLKLYYE